jgi:hypothetical protein
VTATANKGKICHEVSLRTSLNMERGKGVVKLEAPPGSGAVSHDRNTRGRLFTSSLPRHLFFLPNNTIHLERDMAKQFGPGMDITRVRLSRKLCFGGRIP